MLKYKSAFSYLLLMAAGQAWMESWATADMVVPPAANETGVFAHPFDLTQVTLSDGRWSENQGRTVTYLKFLDIDRMLYNFRVAHKLSTNNATPNGGWDKPTWQFRGHFQGSLLKAWAQCYAQLGDETCLQRATTFTAELVKCQANNAVAGYSAEYVGAFPESEFTDLESGVAHSISVPYYVLHKLLAGLLEAWRYTGDANAKKLLLGLSDWVDTRTAKLSYTQMQAVLGTEFGGMGEVLIDIYFQTGDSRWITTAKRFEHNAHLIPLSNDQDMLNGLHGNTQHPKWIGAAREYKSTGNATYLRIARNVWNMVTTAHSYSVGGNSFSEYFRAPNAIANYLASNTMESCNAYNMAKLTRELWMTDTSNTSYFDYYERILSNQLVGGQNPADPHGHITYFSSTNPGGRRGVGPKNPGGTWSLDYDSFWCCQATALETHTKLMDSIYAYNASSLFVNLFVPSVLRWSARNVTVTQTTSYPVTDTSTLLITGTGSWALNIRIPSWTSGAAISINGKDAAVSVVPGSYAVISRSWTSGDTVTVTLPMHFWLLPANDNHALATVAYGPVVLVGNYGDTNLTKAPTLNLSSLKRTSASTLAFSATADSNTVQLGSWYDAQGYNYVTYWMVSGSLPT